jgi:hypothetical protein
MNGIGRAICSTWTSRSWAGCAPVAATASMAATRPSTAPATRTAGGDAAPATTTSTPPSTTTPGWPMSRSWPTSAGGAARGPCAGLGRSSPPTGISIQRVLTDNAFAYRHSHQFRAAVAELGASQRFCRPYHPQTQRQGRAVQPHLVSRVGLCPPLHQQRRAHQGLGRLAAPVQPSPRPHRPRQPATHHPRQQPSQLLQLAAALGQPLGPRGSASPDPCADNAAALPAQRPGPR